MDSSESEFYEFSDQEFLDYDDSQNHDVEGAVRSMYEPAVEIGGSLNNWHSQQSDNVEERLGNNL